MKLLIKRVHLLRPHLLCLLLFIGLPAWGQRADVQMSATSLYGIPVPAGRWVPISVTVSNRSAEAIRAYFRVPAEDADGRIVRVVRTPIYLPARSEVAFISYAMLEAAPAESRRAITLARPELTTMEGAVISRAIITTPARQSQYPDRDDEPASSNASVDPPDSIVLALRNGRDGDTSLDDLYGLAEIIRRVTGRNVRATDVTSVSAPEGQGLRKLPRHLAAYEAVSLVVLDGVRPDLLDAAQRQTLRDFVSTGGTLLIPAPLDADSIAGSFLEELLPVKLIGHREADGIVPEANVASIGPIDFLEPTEIAEAHPGDGEIILRDPHYVHVARKRWGLGQVVFMSFPLDALDAESEQTTELWRSILKTRPETAWRESRLGGTFGNALQSMIGMRTAPWGLTATVILGYVLVAVGVQASVTAPNRPRAFYGLTVFAVILALGLMVASLFQQRDRALTRVQLSVLTLSEEGGGLQREAMAFVGASAGELSLVANPRESHNVVLSPLFASDGAPLIELPPFSAPDTGAYEARVERIWHASAPVASDKRLVASVRFGPQGMTLHADNHLGSPLHAPLLVWNDSVFSLNSLDSGTNEVQVTAANLNAYGDYANAALFRSDQSILRGQIVKDLLTPVEVEHRTGSLASVAPAPQLVGFVDASSVPPVVEVAGPAVLDERVQSLAHVPVTILPSEVGARVKVDAALTQPVIVGGAPIYDPARHQWVEQRRGGNWLIGFAAPPAIGRLRPTRAELTVDLDAPQQTITVRRGQSPTGAAQLNSDGEALATWTNAVGSRRIAIESLTPADVDDNGWVWLAFEVRDTPLAQSAIGQYPWKFRQMGLSYDAEVVGPPVEPVSSRGRNGKGTSDAH